MIPSEIDAAIFYFGVQAREDERRAIARHLYVEHGFHRDFLDHIGMPPVPMSAETERKLAELRTLIGALVTPPSAQDT